jgi:NTP pyrophosphatase (non-canonical NTP hydrolase)
MSYATPPGPGSADLHAWQRFVESVSVYPGRGTLTGLAYTGLGLAEEAGEAAGKVKKLIRGDFVGREEDFEQLMKKELGDVLWYLAALSNELGFSLKDALEATEEKLEDRARRGVIRGSGDER